MTTLKTCGYLHIHEKLVDCGTCPVTKVCWVLNEGKQDDSGMDYEELEKPDYNCPLMFLVEKPR